MSVEMGPAVVVDAAAWHDRFGAELAQLARPDTLLADLAAATGVGGWRREYGRFLLAADDQAPYARLVFERSDDSVTARGQQLVVVDLTRQPPHDGDARRAILPIDALGWASIRRFPDDDRLPTLAEALAVPGDVTIVRYRPGRRCTFRVDDGGQRRYGKVFGDDSGRTIHAAGVALAALSQAGALTFAVAPPIAWDAHRRVLWQGEVAGAPLLADLSRPGALALVERMGAALGSLTRPAFADLPIFDASVQCARTRAYARELGARIPALAVDVTTLGEGLVAIHGQRPGRVCPIHGAPHVNQWLLDGDRLALVDFDRFSLGHPELDVATFLGELDFEEDLATPVAAIAAAFIAGYEAVAGPLDGELLRAYRAHKRLAKALRSARALRPDGATRARRHLASAWAALRGEVAA